MQQDTDPIVQIRSVLYARNWEVCMCVWGVGLWGGGGGGQEVWPTHTHTHTYTHPAGPDPGIENR